MMSMTPRLIPMGGGGASSSSGTYAVNEAAGNINGFGAGAMPDFVLNWSKVGKLVSLWLEAGGTYSAASTSTGFSIVFLPAAITPVAVAVITQPFSVLDNGGGNTGRAQISPGGTINFQNGSVSGTVQSFSTTGFTAAGTKGLASSWQVTYVMP